MLSRRLPSATMSTQAPLEESATAAELKKKQQQAVLIPKTSIQAKGGFVEPTQILPLHREIELLGKTVIIPTIIKSNPKTSQILKEFRKGVKERQNTNNDTKNHSVTIHKKDILPKKDIIVVGQVVRNDNFKKSSIGSVTNPQSDHLRNLQNYPNGTGPIFERILVQNDYKIPQTDNQHCSINTQNQLFTQLERRNHSKQNPEKSSQNGINLENSQNNSSPQNDDINQELRQQYPLQRTPILNYAQNFHHVKDLYEHQKQQVKHQLPQNKTQLPPTETIRGNQAHIKISERIFPQERKADIQIYLGLRIH